MSEKNKLPEKIKLCCITNNVQTGGAGKSLLILVKELSKLFSVSVLARSKKLPDTYDSQSVNYFRIRSGFFPFHYLSGARAPFLINYFAWAARCFFITNTLSIIKSQNPDVILINGFQGVWYLPFLPRRHKVILYARELLDTKKVTSRFAIILINKYVHHVICITENEKNNLPKLTCPVSVVFNSYENEIKVPGDNSLSTPNGIKIGVFGTIQHVKGQYLLLNLVEKYKRELEQLGIKFYLFGGKSTYTTRIGGQEELIAVVKNNKWEKHFEFPGWVENIEKAMHSVDIILRTDTSGCPWGRDIIEAMSNAKPVIAAGYSEVFIKNGETGVLFEPNNIDSMWQAIKTVCDSREKMLRLGQNGFTFAKKNFDASTNAKKVFEIINQL